MCLAYILGLAGTGRLNSLTFMVAKRVATIPHAMTMKDSHRRAPTLCKARLLGTCNICLAGLLDICSGKAAGGIYAVKPLSLADEAWH